MLNTLHLINVHNGLNYGFIVVKKPQKVYTVRKKKCRQKEKKLRKSEVLKKQQSEMGIAQLPAVAAAQQGHRFKECQTNDPLFTSKFFFLLS